MHNPTRQRGAILVTSLLLLLVLTILGLAVMRMTRMQERMAGNARDLSVAFQGAEAALRDGEDRVRAYATRPDTVGALPCLPPVVCYRGVLPTGMADQPQAWWTVNSIQYLTAGVQDIPTLAADPQFVIEEVGLKPNELNKGHDPGDDFPVFQITARSTGASGNTNTVLQSTFARPF
jgi:type IV pilus assembly protein PilX